MIRKIRSSLGAKKASTLVQERQDGVLTPLSRDIKSFKKGDKVLFFGPAKVEAEVVDCYREYNDSFQGSIVELIKIKLKDGRVRVLPLKSPKIITEADLIKLQSDRRLVDEWLKYSYLYLWGNEITKEYYDLSEQLFEKHRLYKSAC